MEASLGPLRVEVTHGESERFTAPLLFVHGLWSDAHLWQGIASFLAHRGWHCIALHLGNASSVAQHVSQVQEAIRALDAPPILIGHDLGALLTVELASLSRAAVALAPLVPGPFAGEPPQALLHAGGVVTRWRRRPLSAPRGRWKRAYPDAARRHEAAGLIHELLRGDLSFSASSDTPKLIVRAEQDLVVSRVDVEQLAARLGAEILTRPGGHALPLEDGWRETAAALHRWVVRRLGAPLLEFYENENEYPV